MQRIVLLLFLSNIGIIRPYMWAFCEVERVNVNAMFENQTISLYCRLLFQDQMFNNNIYRPIIVNGFVQNVLILLSTERSTLLWLNFTRFN